MTALRGWRFAGTLRASQQAMLAAVTVEPPEPLHLVAPPGAGKTLIGLLLAVRRGTRAVVFAPTTTIQRQWAEQARALAPDPGLVSTDPARLGDLTVLTYQRISVPDRGDAFEPIARASWADELVEGGRTVADAQAWLDHLAAENPKAYGAGIRRRAGATRKRLAREAPDRLAAALHPNARTLVEALVAHGVQTIVLDECHHLLDHWALVVAFLEARIRAAARDPLLIGLTATVPSEQDASGFENYTALLGEVDYEQPTPAVVREGNLAPYRDIAWFTEPTSEESVFLAENDRLLAAVIANTLGTADGQSFLRALLVGASEPPADPATWSAWAAAGIGAAYDADFAGAESAAAMLRLVAPTDPLLMLIPESSVVVGDSEIRLLARYLLERVLPDPARAADWRRARRTLADFGYGLTDRGIRRTRDPVDSMLSTTSAKDNATADILALETEREGDRLRAVVVCDFAEHGNVSGKVHARGGALRCFARIVADDRFAGHLPVLVTAQHLRIATRDLAALLPRLGRILGVPPELAGTDAGGSVSELSVPGVPRAAVVAAVSSLLADGFVRIVVGTRGLLGEGWDSPAANTLIDLTAASTSTASQQLRGRTMRLHAAWPEKVAHNWTVVGVHPTARSSSGDADLRRLRRKLASQWGVRVEGEPDVVRGVEHTLTAAQRILITQLRRGEAPPDAVAQLNAATLATLTDRAETYQRWRVGEVVADVTRRSAVTPPSPRVLVGRGTFRSALGGVTAAAGAVGALLIGGGVAAFGMSPSLLALTLMAAGAGTLVSTLAPLRRLASDRRLTRHPAELHRGIAAAVAAGLAAADAGPSDPEVCIQERQDGIVAWLAGAPLAQQEAFRRAVVELQSPVRSPRFLLEIDRGVPTDMLGRIAANLDARPGPGVLLPVPKQIGRRRGAAEAFAEVWRARVGPANLHELRSAEDTSLLVHARRAFPRDAPRPFTRDIWS